MMIRGGLSEKWPHSPFSFRWDFHLIFQTFLYSNQKKIPQRQCINQDLNDVRKNNGLCRTGLNIVEKGKSAVPTIYLDYYLEEYRKGRDLGEICLDMISVYEKHKDDVAFDSSISPILKKQGKESA